MNTYTDATGQRGLSEHEVHFEITVHLISVPTQSFVASFFQPLDKIASSVGVGGVFVI